MKEKLYTIPLNDAFHANDECPFCYIERNIEQDLLDYVLGSGSSYMEADTRKDTDCAGFCRAHFKKMYDYGNTLGNAWILKTHYKKIIDEMTEQFRNFTPEKTSFFKKNNPSGNRVAEWITEKEDSCYICNHFRETYARYMDTFFEMYLHDGDFRTVLASGKGFCLPHFRDLCLEADRRLNEKEKQEFYQTVFRLMEDNMNRIRDDVSWMVEKFDYRNKDADWKNSRDAIQRAMQKLKGGYPADPVYKMNK